MKTVKTKEQNGVLVEYLVENYGQSADFFVPDGAILDGQIDSRRVRSGMPVEYMSKDGKDFDWGQYSEDVEIQKRIANAFVYSFATFRKQGRGLYMLSKRYLISSIVLCGIRLSGRDLWTFTRYLIRLRICLNLCHR